MPVERFCQDMRYAFRILARQQRFTAVAVLTLALGFGANTAINSVLDATLPRSLPFFRARPADEGIARRTRYSWRAVPRRQCLFACQIPDFLAAHRVRDFRIRGPAWLSDTRFEITAKLPAGTKPDQLPEMLQSLLLERFKLELRRDMKEQSVYALVVGQDGPKLKLGNVNLGNHGPTARGADGKSRPLIRYQYLATGIFVQRPL